MSAEIVKILKNIGRYSEAEISDAVHGTLDAQSKANLKQHIKQINDRLHGTPSVDVPRKQKTKKKVTKEQKFIILISKIRTNLQTYCASAALDSWNVDFTINVDYLAQTLAAIVAHHQQLVNSTSNLNKTHLLISFERGRMYEMLKYSAHTFGDWKTIAPQLQICSTTANRYIDFYRLIKVYPRLLVCNMSFSTLMSSAKQVLDYLQIDTDLAAQLRFQLRATRIAGRQFANCIPIGGDIPELMTAHLDWSAGWNLGDELIEDED